MAGGSPPGAIARTHPRRIVADAISTPRRRIEYWSGARRRLSRILTGGRTNPRSIAPEGLAWTGDRRYIAPWTAFGGPVVSMPAGKAANGLPVACLLAGRPGADRQVTVWARRLARAAERHE